MSFFQLKNINIPPQGAKLLTHSNINPVLSDIQGELLELRASIKPENRLYLPRPSGRICTHSLTCLALLVPGYVDTLLGFMALSAAFSSRRVAATAFCGPHCSLLPQFQEE